MRCAYLSFITDFRSMTRESGKPDGKQESAMPRAIRPARQTETGAAYVIYAVVSFYIAAG